MFLMGLLDPHEQETLFNCLSKLIHTFLFSLKMTLDLPVSIFSFFCHSLVYVVFKLKPENTTVYQGHTAVLHCQATGDPPPFIQWKKKDTFLEADKSR